MRLTFHQLFDGIGPASHWGAGPTSAEHTMLQAGNIRVMNELAAAKADMNEQSAQRTNRLPVPCLLSSSDLQDGGPLVICFLIIQARRP